MAYWIMQPHGLIEPMPAPLISIDGIGAIEMIDDRIRVYLYEEEMALDGSSATSQKIVRAKVFGRIATLPMIVGQLAMCLAPRQSGSKPTLVP